MRGAWIKLGLPLFGGLGLLATLALAASSPTTSVMVGTKTLAGSVADGNRYYALNCVACHGRSGQALVAQYPRLSAQIPGYVAVQLSLFRSGRRQNAAMNSIAAHLTDQTIADLSAYLAGTPAANGWPSSDAALRQQGQNLYLNGHPSTGVLACVGCHGPQGQGNAQAGFPRIGGQSPGYFTTAIHELAAQAGRDLGNPAYNTMTKIAKAMTPAETRALDEYIKTLK